MHRTSSTMFGLALVLVLALGGNVEAQEQHQQHHPGDTEAPREQPAETGTGTPGQPQTMEGMQGMMGHMQGMMGHMQGMMQHMRGMMGRGGMMGSRGRGMMAPEDEEGESQQRGMRQGMMGMGGTLQRHMERLTQQLELTNEQQPQVRPLLRSHAKEVIRLRADIGSMAIDVRQLLDAEPVDLQKAKQLLQSIAMKEADLRFAHLTLMQDLNKLLTPEQRQKFRTMRESMAGPSGMTGHGGMRSRERREQ